MKPREAEAVAFLSRIDDLVLLVWADQQEDQDVVDRRSNHRLGVSIGLESACETLQGIRLCLKLAKLHSRLGIRNTLLHPP